MGGHVPTFLPTDSHGKLVRRETFNFNLNYVTTAEAYKVIRVKVLPGHLTPKYHKEKFFPLLLRYLPKNSLLTTCSDKVGSGTPGSSSSSLVPHEVISEGGTAAEVGREQPHCSPSPPPPLSSSFVRPHYPVHASWT